jgi:SlyX protein
MSEQSDENLVDLQIRLTHQEAAIEALTESNIALEKRMLAMEKQLQDIRSMLKEVMPSMVVSQDQETPPPHY